jgi:tetratricopeptide (TPR) repeat protein
VVIDDGRNYIATSQRKWPVIISDSTHPKTSDSWVLYTREFYRLVRDHLTDDGVFVQWVSKHSLTTAEFKIIVRTFQAEFPHASLWLTQGADDQNQMASYGLLVGTAQPLRIDISRLRDRLDTPPVGADLEPYGLHTPAGFLDSFVCAEDTLRQWVGVGPINTDDLPYTQYETRYSEGPMMEQAEFIEPMEDVWPRLTRTGSEAASRQLHDELVLRAKASRLAMLGRLAEAFAVLPDDIRYRQMRRLYEQGPQYIQVLLKAYWDDPAALVFLTDSMFASPADAVGAQSVFERVLALDPDDVSALNMLAALRSDAGDHRVAEAYLERALRRDPRSVKTLCNLGLLRERVGRHADARQCWQKAALLGEDARAADQWGSCLAQEGRMPQALPWFRRAIELQPTLISARLHLAFALWQTGRRPEAVAHLEYVLKMDSENSTALAIWKQMHGPGEAPAGR